MSLNPNQKENTLPPVTSGLKKYRGQWSATEVRHLLKRTTFGAKQQDIDLFLKMSPPKAVAYLVNTEEQMPAPPINYYNDDKYTDEEIPMGQTWINTLKYNGMNNGRRKNSLKGWWIGLMINQQPTLREKMVLFWHNHFATETRTVDNALMLYKHNVLLRVFALGNFKEMVKAITKDPCMLRYLNGTANTKKAPDENYGRELQELFTVGKGPGSHYTEDDVKAAAHVLTGFYIDYKTFNSQFGPGRHDEGDKKFSSFYKNTVITGRKGPDGEKELDDLLNMIFEQEEVSKFICRKLYRQFVYHVIDDTTEKNIITPLAKTFRKNNYEIKPVLEELLGSKHFFDVAFRGSIIKSPIDFAVGLCREYDLGFPPDSNYVDQYNCWLQVQGTAANMQQNIGDPPNVAGWPAYYQVPDFDKMWINSDTLPKRNQFSDRMIFSGIVRPQQVKVQIDPVGHAKQFSDPGNPDTLINDAVQSLYMMDLSDKDKEYLKSGVLLSGLQGKMSDHYWTQAWQNLADKPDDVANRNNVTNKLKNLYKYLMNLPQYQLM